MNGIKTKLTELIADYENQVDRLADLYDPAELAGKNPETTYHDGFNHGLSCGALSAYKHVLKLLNGEASE